MNYILRLAALGLILIARLANGQELPSSVFGTMPMLSDPSVSPNGKLIAAILNTDDTTQAVIAPYGTRQVKPVAALEKEKYRIESTTWANNERILVEVSEPRNIHFNGRRVRVRIGTLFSISTDGKSTIELKKKGRLKRQIDMVRRSPELVSLLPDDKNHILVEIADARDDYYSSIFKVNINTGDFKKFLPNSLRITDWNIDKKGQIRTALGQDEDPRSLLHHIYFRENNNAEWQHIRSIEPYKDETFEPFQYEESTHSLLVLSDHQLRKQAIWRYDLEKGEFTDLIGQAPGKLDVTGPVYWRTGSSKKFVGYSYYDNFLEQVYLDKAQAIVNKQLQTVFARQGLKAYIYSKDRKGERHIIYADSDNSPGKYYLYDHNRKSVDFWFSQYPELENKNLAEIKPFQFKARDGMALNGYLTKPDVESPPLVVLPHGGPQSRDTQHFNPIVQMIANSGIAVLQVNFRGSAGFGNDHLVAGYKEYGKAMQQDLVDAVKWVGKNQLANTDHACMFGASYGGYASLIAGYKTPDMFDCIVSIAGISDLRDMISYDSIRGLNKYYKKELGNIHSREDLEDMKQNSPIYFADQFKAPVLLIHGKSDIRVSYRQSESMADALHDADKDVTLRLLDYGTHSLDDPSNRETAMAEVIAFLEKHLYPQDD